MDLFSFLDALMAGDRDRAAAELTDAQTLAPTARPDRPRQHLRLVRLDDDKTES